jgi:hypothetical protein
MYPIPPGEHLIEMKICRQCTTEFPITDKDMEFYSKVSPSFPLDKGGQGDLISEGKIKIEWDTVHYLIPPPTLCPDCRQQRRLSFRNERNLYKRKCGATGRDIVSIYSPDKPFIVYHQDYWWSDKWDPMSYGKEFDFSRSAFEQMGDMYQDIPKVNLWIRPDMVNCDYCNF